MDKYKRLLSNTMLFAFSSFSSKLLGYFLTAYHTRIMGTGDYGAIQAVNQIGNFLIPIVGMGITNAVIRFGLEKGNDKRQVYTGGLVAVLTGFVVLLALSPVLNMVPFIHTTVQNYWALLLVFVLTSCLRTLNCYFVRARQALRLYAIDAILCALTNLLFNILFLSVLKLGTIGFMLALICSDALSTLFLFCAAHLWKYIRVKQFNTQFYRAMLRYALPLVPANIFWWMMNASDTLFVKQMLSDEWAGIYSASYKLPTVITIVTQFFTEAWQISAFTDGTRTGRENFFSRVFGAYQSVMMLAAAGIILICRPIMAIYVSDAYYIGWKFIPMLAIATVFASFDNFLNTIYMVEKRSGLSLVTMAVGAVVNFVLNWLLIPVWGVNGAALATFVSYFIVFLLRAVNTRGLIRVDFKPLRLAVNCGLLALETLLLLKEVKLWGLWCALITVAMLVLNFRDLAMTAMKLLRRKKPRADS